MLGAQKKFFSTQVYKTLKKINYKLISQYYHTSFFKADEFLIKVFKNNSKTIIDFINF